MGKLDTITKEYMSRPQYFADAFNSSVFKGKQIIKADELSLQEMDPTELGIIIKEDAKDIVQKVRDVLKKSVLMNNGKTAFLLLGIENQGEIHYAMPVKNLIYDALNYGQQVSKIAHMHRKKKDLQEAEFLSGFSKGDKIMPVITLTVYYGNDDWDGPRRLKDMFSEDIGEEILDEVDDYKLHLIIPKEIKDFSVFRSDFGKAMEFIAVSDDAEGIEKLKTNKKFEKVGIETVYLINECTGSNIAIEEGEEVVNVCKGIDGYGKKEREKGIEQGKLFGLMDLVVDGDLSIEKAARRANMTVDEFQKLMEETLQPV